MSWFQGPVCTNADSKVYGFVLPKKTSIDPRPHYRFHSVSDCPHKHSANPYGRSSSLSFSKDGREILKFSFYSSGTTVCETKLSHHALVRSGRIAPASRAFEPNLRYKVLEKAISRIRIVLLLWKTNKRLERARFNSKQAIKNRSIFCSVMFVLVFGFGARACYSTTWYSWRHRFHFYPDPTVYTSTKDIRIHFYSLSRAFPNLCGFGGFDPRVYSVDGRPKRIKKYTDSNESALVWTGPKCLAKATVDIGLLLNLSHWAWGKLVL